MAKKYIDADRLKAEVEKRKKANQQDASEGGAGAFYEDKAVLQLIDSLQQEQSCDTCINDKGCVTCKNGELWEGKEQPSEGFDEAYLNEKIAKASKTWEGVDVDKYMAEMRGYEQPCEDLEAEMGKYFDGWHDDPEYGQAVLPHTYQCVGVSDCEDIARHFYELGKANKEDKK